MIQIEMIKRSTECDLRVWVLQGRCTAGKPRQCTATSNAGYSLSMHVSDTLPLMVAALPPVRRLRTRLTSRNEPHVSVALTSELGHTASMAPYNSDSPSMLLGSSGVVCVIMASSDLPIRQSHA